MRRLATLVGLLLLQLPASAAELPVVRRVEFEAMVNPITALRITEAVKDAEEAGDDLILIRLDTPGGEVTSTETVIKSMLGSEVPIAIWVGPSGAHAASAGFFILNAADVAAMAPGTRTGAASTVTMGGENREDDVLLKKFNEDNAALCRSIADRRGRNVEACQQAIFEAKAYEETVALERGMIDLVVNSEEELLQQIDGREVRRFDGTTVVLRTSNAQFVTSEFPFRRQFLEALSHPILAYLLFLAGIVGIYVEFTHPGGILPGVVGAVCLLLFAMTAQALPISAVGALLILMSIVMFVLEVKVTSFGMLTLGGVISLLIGSMMLVDGPIPEMRVPPGVFVPMTLVIAVFCVFVVHFAYRAHRSRVATGEQGMAGEIGTVTQELAPQGKVFIHGETWSAEVATGSISKGAQVRVVAVGERMCLRVEPVAGNAS